VSELKNKLNRQSIHRTKSVLWFTVLAASTFSSSLTAQAETSISQIDAVAQMPTNSAVSSEVPFAQLQNQTQPQKLSESSLINTLSRDDLEVSQNVTSVSQLSDVKPTDWAFTALQSLVERYGCIAGYPDRTFRGSRATTRYEFAAGLNACLDKINELLSAGLADKVSKEDLAALQKLQEEFAAELALLRGRIDSLEAKTAQIEAQQFSTTTKLSGEAIIAITGGGARGPVFFSDTNRLNLALTEPTPQPRLQSEPPGPPVILPAGTVLPSNGRIRSDSGTLNATFVARVRLDFNTSFTGNDLLITRLEVGNGGTSAGDVLGSFVQTSNYGNVGLDTFGLDYAGVSNNVRLAKLRYDFNVGPDLRVSLGPSMHFYDHVDKNSYANNEAADFSSTFFINNPLIGAINLAQGSAGAALDWNPGKGAFSLRALYLSAYGNEPTGGPTNPNAPPPLDANRGLFGNPYEGVLELEFAPKSDDGKSPFAIRLQYIKGYFANREGEAGGVNFEWKFAKNIAIFGRYGFGRFTLTKGVADTGLNTFVNTESLRSQVTLSPNTFMVGLAFPDLFKSGALAAIAVGQPFIEKQVGDSTQTNLEIFYNFPISDNISITPDLQFIFNPSNNSSNSAITIATLRTVFRF
jgi:hypothetical protein